MGLDMSVRNHTLSDTERMLLGAGSGFCIGDSASIVFSFDSLATFSVQTICAYLAALAGGIALMGEWNIEWSARIVFAVIAFAIGTEVGRHLVECSTI
ncbi:hypothetical protein QN219_31880 [Sinorhizobium sp. 7-81]|uniref:hypothetical protein n=1 Tax=Sinorhizobium sp. 8-89 TaxID=3049089 RepID=UPI0024C30D09|nr:hypothetical protein [Sinorhizobium sp. 8-89]MDK1494528.1 hypothetical protein [Sinorhizobium sp. 8-89]